MQLQLSFKEIMNLYGKINFLILILISDINDFFIWLMTVKIIKMNKSFIKLNLKIYFLETCYWFLNYLSDYLTTEDKQKKKILKQNTIRYIFDMIVSYSYVYP